MPAPVPASPLQACQKALKTVAVKCCGLFFVYGGGSVGLKSQPLGSIMPARKRSVAILALCSCPLATAPTPALIITPTQVRVGVLHKHLRLDSAHASVVVALALQCFVYNPP